MKRFDAEPLACPKAGVAESPVWFADRLWYCDIEAGALMRFDPATGAHDSWQIDGKLGAFAPVAGQDTREDHLRLMAGTERGFELLTLSQSGLARDLVASPFAPGPGIRFNDGIADPKGRYWSGTIERDRKGLGRLYLLDHGEARQVMEGFKTLNGLAFSADGRRLYVSDSFPGIARVWTMRLDDEGMPLEERQPFLDLSAYGGRPDGAALDADGCYWIAASDSGRILRFDPHGRLDAEIRVPTRNPTNITFGGSDLKTAYLTSLNPQEGGDALAGSVFAVSLPYQGRPADLYSNDRKNPWPAY
ncbi:SMP-30/gluconolactonase/LRE family protein [Allorhizobium sp. BGMRC 0089]|uniref:SMP-30/gluconolactonase/LRE family protein n=1 Tax=Allorhizobium sonneratiae TaxID=2934936 RepID=UPI0020345A3A|nr:SMP-30/gluconolactonase/LRE family protein [Allorhizobium sonneratiae]MCM2293088.1 SMP-30/gluconolactonase/LRE family protein [Allorhizobium sonneratiae]